MRHSNPLLDIEDQGERTVNELKVSRQESPEIEKMAAQSTRDRLRVSKWDLDVAVFLSVMLLIIIVLLFQGIELGIVVPVAIFGLAMVWLIGWRRGRQIYPHYYHEWLSKLEQKLKKEVEKKIDEEVQRALQEGEW